MPNKSDTPVEQPCLVLPCPFCGGDSPPPTVEHFQRNMDARRRGGFAVVCPHCETEGPRFGTREDAVEAWNTRAVSRMIASESDTLTDDLRMALLEGQIELHRDELDWWAAEMDFWRCKYLREHPELDSWDYAINARQRESERGF